MFPQKRAVTILAVFSAMQVFGSTEASAFCNIFNNTDISFEWFKHGSTISSLGSHVSTTMMYGSFQAKSNKGMSVGGYCAEGQSVRIEIKDGAPIVEMIGVPIQRQQEQHPPENTCNSGCQSRNREASAAEQEKVQKNIEQEHDKIVALDQKEPLPPFGFGVHLTGEKLTFGSAPYPVSILAVRIYLELVFFRFLGLRIFGDYAFSPAESTSSYKITGFQAGAGVPIYLFTGRNRIGLNFHLLPFIEYALLSATDPLGALPTVPIRQLRVGAMAGLDLFRHIVVGGGAGYGLGATDYSGGIYWKLFLGIALP